MHITSSTYPSAAGGAPAPTSSASNTSLTEDQFLKLLTQQLENQDPLQPTDDTQFLAQMAQFTSLQETDTLNHQINRLTAASYIGSTVTVNPGSGAPVTGQVTAVDTSGSDPKLVINGFEYPLAELQMVTSTAPASPAAGSASASALAADTAAASAPASLKRILLAATPKP
jgi:flagellar basal-body rod modification protein FlgD